MKAKSITPNNRPTPISVPTVGRKFVMLYIPSCMFPVVFQAAVVGLVVLPNPSEQVLVSELNV